MRGLRKLGIAALAAAAAGAVFATQPASAATAPAPTTDRVAHLVPEAGPARSAGSGGVAGDVTGDGWADVLGRCTCGNGVLYAYPHSQTFNGLGTYPTVTAVNDGWSGMRWMGTGDVDGDGDTDVLGITPGGVTEPGGDLFVARHSGSFDGMSTLEPGLEWLGTGWHINDLVSPVDLDGNGRTDLIARRAGTGDTYYYQNLSGINGAATFAAPVLLASGGDLDVYQGMADVTLDGILDLVFVTSDGDLGVFDLANGLVAELGYGWAGIDAVVLTDVDHDTAPDILGRDAANGDLLAYAHVGTWNPANPYGTYRVPEVVGYGWHLNDIIT